HPLLRAHRRLPGQAARRPGQLRRFPEDRRSEEGRLRVNNLHRELAPISTAAWADLEAEARRTFERHVAGRRVLDAPEPGGSELAAVAAGHIDAIASPAEGVAAHLRRSQPVVELRVPFTVDRQQVDDVERGARDADWQSVKDAARQLAFAEDRAVFE